MKFTIYDLRFTRALSLNRLVASFGLLFAIVNLAVADESDAKLSQRIVGTWAIDKSEEMSIYPNGSLHSRFSNVYSNETKTVIYEGTWRIKDGCLVITVTNAMGINSKFEPVGSVDRCKIVKLDRTFLVLEFNSQTNDMAMPKSYIVYRKRK